MMRKHRILGAVAAVVLAVGAVGCSDDDGDPDIDPSEIEGDPGDIGDDPGDIESDPDNPLDPVQPDE